MDRPLPLTELEKLAKQMVSGRFHASIIPSTSIKRKIIEEAELGARILELIATVYAADKILEQPFIIPTAILETYISSRATLTLNHAPLDRWCDDCDKDTKHIIFRAIPSNDDHVQCVECGEMSLRTY